MLELFIAALVQFSVLFGGTAPQKSTKITSQQTLTVQSSTAPTSSTGIGTGGWDDKN